MKPWIVLAFATATASLASTGAHAQDAPVDSLALARQYTDWLLIGQADSLLAHSVEGTSTRDEYADLSRLIAERAGFELEVSEETWKLRNGDCQYWRTSQFSAIDEPLLIRWVIDREGRIAGIGAGPLSQAPEIESETCGAPTG
ncbi:MAG TPA: hypothetical protein VIE68_09225 [Gemmatimonadota bacterium]|jgi:hypothetical protein